MVWQSEGARVCYRPPRSSVRYFFFFGRLRGGLIFSPLNFFSFFFFLFFFLGGGVGGGGVGGRREFFGFRPNKIIPKTSGNPEYMPHPWSQASSIRLYTFTTFSLKTITANTAVAFIREAYLTQEVHSWTAITVAKVLLQSIILRYIYVHVLPRMLGHLTEANCKELLLQFLYI